jgi:CheY-like chemotaxis protein
VGVWYWTVRDRHPGFGLGRRPQVVVGLPEAEVARDLPAAMLRDAEQARDEAMGSAVRARREALAQSQVNAQLLATMGYEIRTPMSGVIGLAGLLLTTDLDPVQRRYAAGLHTAGNELLGVINAILDPSDAADLATEADATPPAAAAATAPAGADPASATQYTPPAPRRVLVVEDNEINQMVAVGMLTGLGYQPDVANDGIEAVDMAAAHEYDAVLMDCRMPRMDGFDATAELRRHEGNGRHTPIIALTASALVDDRVRCLDAGMDDFLAKPVNSADLDATLARWVADAALNEVHVRRGA